MMKKNMKSTNHWKNVWTYVITILIVCLRCLVTAQGVVPQTATAIVPTFHSDTTNKKYIAKTAAFKAFMLPDSNALTITCQAHICASGTACDVR